MIVVVIFIALDILSFYAQYIDVREQTLQSQFEGISLFFRVMVVVGVLLILRSFSGSMPLWNSKTRVQVADRSNTNR